MQIVETLVIVTVEMVLEVVTKVELPEVTVLVTGQVVTVSQVTTVVVASPGARGVPAGDETAEVTLGAEGVPAEVPLAGGDPAEELTGETPVGTADRGVEPTSAVVVSVTGRTVVETGIVEVTTVVECAGQLVTVGAQLVIVTKLVVYTVEVVIWTGVVITGVEAAEVPTGVSPGADETEEAGIEDVGTDVPLGTPGIPADELTGETPLGLGTADRGVEPTAPVVVSVTGQTVVEIGIVEVTTVVESAGQLVTVGAQLVIVTKLVVYTVDVVIWTGVVITGVEVAEVTSGVSPAVEEIAEEGKIEDPGTDVPLATPGIPADELTGETPLGLDTAGTESELVAVAVVSVTGQTVVERAIVEVTTTVDPAGQLVTVGAQLVIVIKLVVNTVEVVI